MNSIKEFMFERCSKKSMFERCSKKSINEMLSLYHYVDEKLTLNHHVDEKLTLNNQSQLKSNDNKNFKGYNESILDVCIKDLNHLKQVLYDYFESNNKTSFTIDNNCALPSKLTYKKINRQVNNINKGFMINFYPTELYTNCYKYLIVAQHTFKKGNNNVTGIVMQMFVKSYTGKWVSCDIVGSSKPMEYKDNLLDWFIDKKENTIKHQLDGDINLMVLFGLMK